MLNTPVLFIIFNRPETTKQVFESIRLAKPRQLFIAADGPRKSVPGETERCREARKIATNVDWDCEVHTFFRENNVGCGRGPSEAISWLFEHVDKGIILEDDCLPAPSFFPFCEELLERYKDDVRIQTITGSNLLQEWKRGEQSYHFSLMAGIWGWATWRRAWKEFDFFVLKWKDEEIAKLFKMQFLNTEQRDVYVNALNETVKSAGEVSWWDYQWMFARVINSSYGIVPRMNMIKNIGFGSGATHTVQTDSPITKLKAVDLYFPLKHPKTLLVDKEHDDIHSSVFYPIRKKSIIKKGMISLFGKF